MSTKAQDFRVAQQRAAHAPKPKTKTRPRGEVANGAPNGVAAAPVVKAVRNRSIRAGKKGGAKLEESLSGKPSRKSTRRSQGHIKTTSNLARQAIREARSPQTRAAQAKVAKKR